MSGGTAGSETLTLSSTANATKGKIVFGTSAYDEVNNRLGIGTTSPGTRLHIVAEDAGGVQTIFSTYGIGSNTFISNKANGTLAVPTDVTDTQQLGRFQFAGWNNGNFRVGARINIAVDGPPTVGISMIPTRMEFYTASTTTASFGEKMRLDSRGVLYLIGTTGAFKTSNLTTVQRDAIVSPSDSMEIYNTDRAKKQIRRNGVWEDETTDPMSIAYSVALG